MSRKVYYYGVAIALSFVFLLTLYNIFLRELFGAFHVHEPLIKDVTVIFIVAMELCLAPRKSRIFGSLLAIPFIIGYLLRVMHWPGGAILFIASGIAILLVLTLTAISEKKHRLQHLSLLLFPATHFIYFITLRSPFNISWWTIDLICMAVTALCTWVWIARRQY